ncbi:MAG: ribulose-phosphate 3-epimerase, partial [Oligoflexales bacterium]|nr:ribulose-phosphate 3-epimerase [Oligoflexales bacterium]
FCLGTHVINEIRSHTHIPSEYHLMVEEPSRILSNFKPDEGDILSIHYEACRNLHRDIIKIKQLGFKPGVVLNPATPLDAIEYVIDEVDVITIMTVNPGYAGQKLIPQTLKKIEILRDWRKKENLRFEINVDGNVNSENIAKMVTVGADMLVAGSSGLFLKGQPLETSFKHLEEYIREGRKNAG